jgi:hypothetical protein
VVAEVLPSVLAPAPELEGWAEAGKGVAIADTRLYRLPVLPTPVGAAEAALVTILGTWLAPMADQE